MIKLEVGKQFKEGITRYGEGCKFDIDDTGCNLIFYYNNPSEEEIKDITKGNVKYGYYKEDNVLLMLFKFGEQQWIDSPYSIHLSKHLTKLQEITEGIGYAVNIYLVNANNGNLEGMRLISLSTKTSKMLRMDILEQKESTYDGFEKTLSNIYNKYPTKMLVSMCKTLDKLE